MDAPVFTLAGLTAVTALGFAFQSWRRSSLRLELAERRLAEAEREAHARALEAAKSAAEMRRVLENVEEGFVWLSPQGDMTGERPAILDRWLGPSTDRRFAQQIRQVDSLCADAFELGWEQLAEGVLPVEVAIDQLPVRIGAGARTLSLRYRPVLDGETLREVFVVLSDATDEVRREHAEAERRNLLGAIKHILRDRDGFTQFAREATALVSEITSGDFSHAEILRQVHTLKGNAATFEIETVTQFCHELEQRLIDEQAGLSPAECERLLEVWRPIAKLAGGDASEDAPSAALSVSKDEHARLLDLVLSGGSRAEIAERLQSWELEPARRRLDRLADRARATALRLGKGQVEVVVDDGGVRVPEREWGAFWGALVHVVRNALDHGIESGEERLRAGKPEFGTLTLRSLLEDGCVIVEVLDDGRGIDWERLRAKAKSRGLPHLSREDLVEAMFTDGVSSRDVANEFSGRGVGMSAVRQACQELGGSIEVTSVAGSGSRFVVRFPSARVSMVTAIAAA